ncbi:MAG: hypothetical protein LBP62_08515 [Clostridiales bacterium]|jgi:hypothetical protein|nr:hypothetical protein [Clostridiales bacterium]
MFGFLFNNRGGCRCGCGADGFSGCGSKTCFVPKICCERKCKKVYEIKEHCLCKDECKVDYQNIGVGNGGFIGKNCGGGWNEYADCGVKFDENLQYAGCGQVKKPPFNCGCVKEKEFGIGCRGGYSDGGYEYGECGGFGGFGGCKKCGCR